MRTIEDAIKNYNHICWYPSAGEDFKPLLFISNWYYKKNSVPMDEGQVLRNCLIFLHSQDTKAHVPIFGHDDFV